MLSREGYAKATAVTDHWLVLRPNGKRAWPYLVSGTAECRGYARQRGPDPLLSLHRLIMDARPGDRVQFAGRALHDALGAVEGGREDLRSAVTSLFVLSGHAARAVIAG